MQFDDRVGIDRVMQVMIMALRNINDLRFVMNSFTNHQSLVNSVIELSEQRNHGIAALVHGGRVPSTTVESESSALASTRRVEPNTEMEPGPQIIPPEGNTDREGGSYYHSLRQVKAQRKKTLSRGQESWVWRLLRCKEG